MAGPYIQYICKKGRKTRKSNNKKGGEQTEKARLIIDI